MDSESLPFYNRLSFKFLASTACFIFLIEAILYALSINGMEMRLVSIRENILRSIPNASDKLRSLILPSDQVDQILETYSRNIILMVFVIVGVVVTGLYMVMRFWFLNPIRTILNHNEQSMEGEPEMISDSEIVNSELGLLMRSRNEMLESLNSMFNRDALETLCEAVDAKDEYTQGHSRRVGLLGEMLARELDLPNQTCENVHYSGTLHDIGKIGVSDEILTKPDQLTDDEFEEIKEHPVRGEKMIQFSNIGSTVLDGIRHHHERYDGDGYPGGLSGEDIPEFGRILAVADAVDAMLSNRHYRDALELDTVLEELAENKSKQFDPDVAEAGLIILKGDYSGSTPEQIEELIPA